MLTIAVVFCITRKDECFGDFDPKIETMGFADSTDPFRQQQETVRRLVRNPALGLAREQKQRIQDVLDPPAMRRIREQQQRIQDVLDPPAMRRIREQLTVLLNSPPLQSIKAEPDVWLSALPSDVVSDLDDYETSLRGRVTAAADVRSEEGASGVWFGAASWSVLVHELEGLLKVQELLAAGLTAANMTVGEPPTALIAVLIMLVAAAELALWLVKSDLDD